MRTLRFLLQKEFRQIFRNKSILGMMLVVPVVQLLILPLAADFEIKNIHIAIVDEDHSTWSRELTSKILASGYFVLSDFKPSFKEAYQSFESDQSDIILHIPKDFEKNLTLDQ